MFSWSPVYMYLFNQTVFS